MQIINLLLVGLLLCQSANVFSQDFPIQKLAVEDGLGHSIVYRTHQTSDGYLWFSTDNGLTRYDGNHFTNYTSEDGLGSNFILGVAEWKNNLYISSFGAGLMVLDSGVFKPVVKDSIGQPYYPIHLIPYEKELWVTDRFKRALRFKDNTFSEVSNADLKISGEKFPIVYQVEKASDGGLYLATAHGLFHFRYNTFTRIEIPGLTPYGNIVRLVELKNKNLMLATPTNLIEFDLRTNRITTWIDNETFAPESSLMEDHEGNVWAASMKGNLYLCRRGVPGTKHVTKVSEGTVINQIYQDREKNIWLSTYGEGVWRIQSIYIRNHSIKGCIVADMTVDPHTKNLIVTTTNAGFRFFSQDENRYPTGFVAELNTFFKNRKLLNAASSLPDGTLFFSSHNQLYRWWQKRIDSVKVPRAISTLYPQPRKNRIWIGSRLDLNYTDTLFKQVTHIDGFDKIIIRTIAEDENGNILLGTDSGVYLEQGTTFTLLATDRNQKLYINALYLNKETNRVWVATNSGLGFIENNRIKLLDHPLTNVRCNAITSDNLGNLWVGTVKGLLRNHKGKFEMITTKDGVAQANIIKLIFQSESGLLSLLTPTAASVIEIENFLKNTEFSLPNIIVEKVSTEYGSLLFNGQPIHLNSAVKDLTIMVSLPVVRNRDKMIFSYQINDKTWNEFDGQKIVLHTLPYGSLNLTIKAEEVFKPDVNKTTTLSFRVKRPFYVTWWFIALVGLLLFGFIYWIIAFYSKRKNVRLVQENKRLDVEHKALRNLLNPHFIYNAINSIHAFVLQNDQRKTLGYLSKFSQLVRLNLELLATDRVALDKELKNISLYLEFEKLRFADKLNYEIHIDPNVDLSEIQIPSFIIQPFLENAIWHGLLPRSEGGNLSLTINQQNERLVIVIEDDGIGINTSLKHPRQDLVQKDGFGENRTSMGIHIIKERIDLMNKLQKNYELKITDKSDLNGKATGTGTIVKISIPTNK